MDSKLNKASSFLAQAERKHGPKEFKSTPKPELQTQNILGN